MGTLFTVQERELRNCYDPKVAADPGKDSAFSESLSILLDQEACFKLVLLLHLQVLSGQSLRRFPLLFGCTGAQE